MLLKKYSYLLLAALMATSVACKDDEGGTVIDVSDPTATLTSPTEGQLETGFDAGSAFNVTGTVTDNGGLQSVSLMVEAPNDGAIWYTRNWSATQINGRTLDINETIEIPADAEAGTHVMTLNATDLAGNDFQQTWNINVLPDAGGEAVTFTVNIPAAVGDDPIYIAGEFANADGTPATWNEPGTNEALMMTKVTDTQYTITVDVMESADDTPGVIQYKYFRGAGWGGGEQTAADCAARPDRTLTLPLDSNEITDEVEAWEGHCG